MGEIARANSISGIEEKLKELPPAQEIAVIADNSYFYIEDPGGMIRNFERLIYEGPAKDFTP